jgi:hypothetical protein
MEQFEHVCTAKLLLLTHLSYQQLSAGDVHANSKGSGKSSAKSKHNANMKQKLTRHAQVFGLSRFMATFWTRYRLTTWILETFPSYVIFTEANLRSQDNTDTNSRVYSILKSASDIPYMQ